VTQPVGKGREGSQSQGVAHKEEGEALELEMALALAAVEGRLLALLKTVPLVAPSISPGVGWCWLNWMVIDCAMKWPNEWNWPWMCCCAMAKLSAW